MVCDASITGDALASDAHFISFIVQSMSSVFVCYHDLSLPYHFKRFKQRLSTVALIEHNKRC